MHHRRNNAPTAHRWAAGFAAVALLGLAACSPEPAPPTVGQQVDAVIEKAGQVAQQAGETVNDAAITAAVAAELALDKDLSALKVDIETTDGRVALRGTAPSADARDRATLLAEGVKGVRSVDNQLTVVAG